VTVFQSTIPRLTSVGENDEEEEMPKDNSPDENGRFRVECPIYHRYGDRLQGLRKEAKAEFLAMAEIDYQVFRGGRHESGETH
jgi:hypothetical protein